MLLQIPNPCHEDWAKMSPDTQGRFCQSCQKTVVDFTDMTDNQVVRFFKENENICGRFNALQINRSLSETIEIRRPNRHPAWKYMVWSLLAVGTMTSCQVQGQVSNAISMEEPVPELGDPIVDFEQAFVKLKGMILDVSSETGIAYATISVKNSTVYTKSDANGLFEIEIPQNQVPEKMELIVKAEGYESEKRVVSSKQFGDIIIINLRKEVKEPNPIPVKPPVLMGKVAYPYPDKK